MKSTFDNLSVSISKQATKTYSTSFSLGILFLNKKLRNAIYSIYGFVRVADEIVDSFEGYDQKNLLAQFSRDTYESIENKISCNPILNSFQHAVHQYNIEISLIETFLKSMEMDLQKVDYTEEKYQQYILGSAEVVGLMCLSVFTSENLVYFQCIFIGKRWKRIMRFGLVPENSSSNVVLQRKVTAITSPAKVLYGNF